MATIQSDRLESAAAIAAQVRAGTLSAVEVARDARERIARLDGRIGAFQHLPTANELILEARTIDARPDRASLPLAGVPIAIKDSLPVRDMPMRLGSAATPEASCTTDHEVVRRLRAAGALLIGKTRVPEICIWGATDSAFGVTRNPWNLHRTAGGSSGGSAAAVAGGMVPLAIGNDGLGSIRIPAACCGVLGLKPGYGTVPAQLGANDWYGFAENGPFATTVEDAALLLSVLAAQPALATAAMPKRPLRIALSTRAPSFAIRIDREYAAATHETAELLRAAGHHVETSHPPYSVRAGVFVLAHWFAGATMDTQDLDLSHAEPRTRTHVRAGRWAQRLRLVGPKKRQWWRQRLERFFARYDLLLTPMLAAPPIAALEWHQKSWLSNLLSNSRYAPFGALWNLAGFPAASVPAGSHSSGVPLAVQLVGRPGAEATLLAVARQIEAARPWPRVAPALMD